MKMIRRTLASTAALLALLPMVSCSSATAESAEPEPSPSNAIDESSGAETIAEVFEKIGCEEGDVLGTDGTISDPGNFDYEPAMVKNGTCKPIDGGSLTFFYQYESAEDAQTAVANGSIELGATDQLFVDGAVLILARDAATSTLLSDVADPVS